MTKERGKINWGFWIPVTAGAAIVIWCLVLPSWNNVCDHWTAQSWPETVGRVTLSKTYTFHSQKRLQTGYAFEYQYRVNGQLYENSRYSFRNAEGDKSIAVTRFGPADEVTVYYDPASPHRSVIDRELSPWWNYVVLGSLILIPTAFVIRYKSWSRKSRRDSKSY